jgi:hypothetical protein
MPISALPGQPAYAYAPSQPYLAVAGMQGGYNDMMAAAQAAAVQAAAAAGFGQPHQGSPSFRTYAPYQAAPNPYQPAANPYRAPQYAAAAAAPPTTPPVNRPASKALQIVDPKSKQAIDMCVPLLPPVAALRLLQPASSLPHPPAGSGRAAVPPWLRRRCLPDAGC